MPRRRSMAVTRFMAGWLSDGSDEKRDVNRDNRQLDANLDTFPYHIDRSYRQRQRRCRSLSFRMMIPSTTMMSSKSLASTPNVPFISIVKLLQFKFVGITSSQHYPCRTSVAAILSSSAAQTSKNWRTIDRAQNDAYQYGFTEKSRIV